MRTTHEIITAWLSELPTAARKAAISPETDLLEAGILDSIAVLDLICFLEARFKISLPVEEFVPENFRTVAAIAALATRLMERVA
jgi:acyl carrier protein